MLRTRRMMVGALLAVLLIVAVAVIVWWPAGHFNRTRLTAYFTNSNGIFPGDDIRILGVTVGHIDTITPEPSRAKVTFWVDNKYKVPADAKAVIIAPTLVSIRAIQLLPAYTGGPAMQPGAVISQDWTAVPVEWDDFREQLRRLTDTLQPTEPGGVSTLGALVNTAADNLRGEGGDIRHTVLELSEAFSALGDHSGDLFSTISNLSTIVTALQNSTGAMAELNQNLATVTGVLANQPNEVGDAVRDISDVLGLARQFIADNTETVGTTSDKLASVTTTLNESLDDIKQALHLAPNAFQNFANIYQPAQSALSGALVMTNFSNPISFLCGAIQAASRLGAEQSAKLCVQYLAPIMKNRQYNFPPIGENLFVGTSARPNEITYSEDWMRPDYVPPQPPPPPASPEVHDQAAAAPLAAEAAGPGEPPPTRQTDPASGLPGLMVPGS